MCVRKWMLYIPHMYSIMVRYHHALLIINNKIMDRTINIKKNYLLYPFQLALTGVVHMLLAACRYIAPEKYKEKLLALENNETLINIIGLTIFNALGGFLLMITNIKLANVLGAAIYGIFSYYVAIGEVGINFVRYGRDKSMIRDLIQQPEKYDSLVANTFALNGANLFIFTIIICLFSKQLDVPVNFACISIIAATCLVSLDLQPIYESIKLMSWHSLYTILQRLLNLLLIWLPLLFLKNISLNYIGIALILSWGIVLIIQYKEVITQLCIKIKGNVSAKSLYHLYKSNFLIALSCMMGVAFGPLIRLILKNYVDDVAVGLYAACFQIFLISKFILTQIARVGNPMMAEAGKNDCSKESRIKFVKKYILIMLIGSIPFALPLIFCSGIITDLCFVDEYYEIRSYLPLFGFYTLVMSVGTVFEQFLISMRKDKTYFTIYVGCSILTVIMAFALIPLYHTLGGIIAFIIPNIIARVLYASKGLCLLKQS